MRIIAAVSCVVAMVVFLIVMYRNRPVPVTYRIQKPVWETKVRKVTRIVTEERTTADGRTYKVAKPVWYSMPVKAVKFVPGTVELPVTENQTMQFGALTLIGLVLLAYAGIILVAFGGMLFGYVALEDGRAKIIEIQLTILIAFASGIAATYFGVILNPSRNDEMKLLREQLSALQSAVGGLSSSQPYNYESSTVLPSPDVGSKIFETLPGSGDGSVVPGEREMPAPSDGEESPLKQTDQPPMPAEV